MDETRGKMKRGCSGEHTCWREKGKDITDASKRAEGLHWPLAVALPESRKGTRRPSYNRASGPSVFFLQPVTVLQLYT